MEIFLNGVKDIEGIRLYGDFSSENRLPVVSLNIDGFTSSELAERLWRDYGIAVRAGSHCAPLLHKRFGAVESGMVRFSFSYFNAANEIEAGVSALKDISKTLK